MTDEPQVNQPNGWESVNLCEVAQLNPRLDKSVHSDSPRVSFVPMPSVEAGTGVIDVSQTRRLEEVKKGYTSFREGDVLFAKITPCMENGKMAVVPPLKNVLGFGSTEFHVLRPYCKINAKYIYFFVSSATFRRDAEHNMTGAVGQRRVPSTYLSDQIVPLPPANEQRRIVAKIEELFSELDKGIESLKAARAKLDVYRQAVLKHAFEGKLTAQWREENKDKLETPEQLLARIQQDLEERYKQQLQEWKAAVKKREESGKTAKKLAKPKRPTEIAPINGDPRKELPGIPKFWEWLNLIHVGQVETGTTPSTKVPENYGGKLPFFKPTDLDQGAHVRSARNHLSPLGEESARVISAGSTLVTCIGATIGKTGLAVTRCATNQQINSISPCAGFDPKFVYLQMVAPFLNDRIKIDASATTLPILNKSKFGELPFVLCSLPEQYKLVRLVEERFMAAERSEKEINSALNQAKILRQSILKKAYSGQLVPQDPYDEPASILLERIRTEKAARSQINKRTKHRREKATA